MDTDIILVDKPKGITSFDCIRILRKEFRTQTQNIQHKIKMGHAGTLDPMATGLMIIGVGPGTKKLNEYLKLPKTYNATVRLGIQTDTGDLEGKIIKEASLEHVSITLEDIKKAVSELVGSTMLYVPKYSAIKKDGKPLYKYARSGQEVEIPQKEMVVHGAEVTKYLSPDIHIEFDVASGTYIRSLAEELGRKLGVPATLADLRRTRIGEFRIEDARNI